MKYVGSKNRLSKHIVPIIQEHLAKGVRVYWEPFVGGANVIDKVKFHPKIGSDSHPELIALLQYVQDLSNPLPDTITEEEYIKVRDSRECYEPWYVGLVGFCATWGSKYFGGFARSFKSDGITPRDVPNEGIRNLERQRPNLKNVQFIHSDFREMKIDNALIYCDPPYRGATKYGKTSFPYDEFYEWCRHKARKNIVLVSEYNMPDDFECIWEKEHFTSLTTQIGSHKKRTEKLFIKGVQE